jgi:hypothetical protein
LKYPDARHKHAGGNFLLFFLERQSKISLPTARLSRLSRRKIALHSMVPNREVLGRRKLKGTVLPKGKNGGEHALRGAASGCCFLSDAAKLLCLNSTETIKQTGNLPSWIQFFPYIPYTTSAMTATGVSGNAMLRR